MPTGGKFVVISSEECAKISAGLVAAPDMSGVRGACPDGGSTSSPATGPETCSISVSGNWRITFELDDEEIYHLDLEDYHEGDYH